jgi:hypothetical protein
MSVSARRSTARAQEVSAGIAIASRSQGEPVAKSAAFSLAPRAANVTPKSQPDYPIEAGERDDFPRDG